MAQQLGAGEGSAFTNEPALPTATAPGLGWAESTELLGQGLEPRGS